MSPAVRLAAASLRRLILTTLAFLVMALGSAQVRETVLVTLQEQGVQRMYETEVHVHGSGALHHAERRMGRKPFEQSPLRAARIHHATGAPPTPLHGPATPRAPPHAARAPPLA